MSKIFYAIEIDGQQSGSSPYGQKDAFPIAQAEFASGGTTYDDYNTHNAITRTRFAVHGKFHSNVGGFEFAKESDQLSDYIRDTLTKKQNPTKYTIKKIIQDTDASAYVIDSTAEHDSATIAAVSDDNATSLSNSQGGVLVIRCDNTIVSTTPAGKDSPTNRTEINHTKGTINGK